VLKEGVYKMPKTISFNKMNIENIVLVKQEGQWKLGINLTLRSDDGGSLGQNVLLQLDEARQLQVRNFIQPFVQIARDAMDIQEVINYVDPGEEEIAAPEEEAAEEVVDVLEPLP